VLVGRALRTVEVAADDPALGRDQATASPSRSSDRAITEHVGEAPISQRRRPCCRRLKFPQGQRPRLTLRGWDRRTLHRHGCSARHAMPSCPIWRTLMTDHASASFWS